MDETPSATTPQTVVEFRAEAATWLADNGDAPHDYGAICPPDLIDAGIAWQHRLRDAGFVGIHWPVEHGGRGLTIDHTAAWMLECAKAGVPPVLNMVGLVLTGGAILRYGTDQQQDVHLRATLDADHVWCQLFSEPGAGSDLASLATRADQDGDRFIVNGQKVWCSGGRYSNWGILMARTDPEARPHQGISFFLCPMDLPGIEIRPLRQMTGEAEFDEVFFTDVELPADALLGPLHGGWGVGMAVLTSERGHIGTAVISLERRLEQMVRIGEDRMLDPLELQTIAALISTGSAYKAMAQRQGPEASTAASLMKLGITQMSFEASMLRGALAGADALLDGAESSGMLAAPGGRIAGGTSEVQRNIIGERLLGLPRANLAPDIAAPTDWLDSSRAGEDVAVRVMSSDQVSVAIHEFGGTGRPLLLSHATGFHGYCYLPIADRLNESFTSYALDYRGHGATPRPDDWAVDWDRYGDDAVAAARRIAPDGGLIAFGHSMGGAALLMAAHRDPDLFDLIVAFEPIVFPTDVDRTQDEPSPMVEGARRRRPSFESFELAVENYSSKFPMQSFDPDVVRLYVGHGFRPAPEGVRLKCDPEHEARTFETGATHSTWELLPDIDTRVVVVAGGDGMGPADVAPKIAERLPNCVYVEQPDTDHFGPFTDPGGTADLILDMAR